MKCSGAKLENHCFSGYPARIHHFDINTFPFLAVSVIFHNLYTGVEYKSQQMLILSLNFLIVPLLIIIRDTNPTKTPVIIADIAIIGK